MKEDRLLTVLLNLMVALGQLQAFVSEVEKALRELIEIEREMLISKEGVK